MHAYMHNHVYYDIISIYIANNNIIMQAMVTIIMNTFNVSYEEAILMHKEKTCPNVANNIL